jgi:hypothetical protein
MADAYDQLIHTLGLDECRLDRILGRPLRQIGTFPGAPRYQHSPVTISVCELADGHQQWGFEWNSRGSELGMIPLTPRNRDSLKAGIREARRLLEEPYRSRGVSAGLLRRIGHFLMGEPVADFGRFPDPSPHLGCSLQIRWFQPCGHFLVFRFHGRGRIDASILAQAGTLDRLEAALDDASPRDSGSAPRS